VTGIVLLVSSSAGDAHQRSVLEALEKDKAASDLRLYYAMLDAYGSGDETRSVDLLLRWPRARLENALAEVNRSNDPRAPWSPRIHGLAAMLHTDVALRLAPGAETKEAFWHIDLASRLLSPGTTQKAVDIRPLAERWYEAVARALRDRSRAYVAELLLRLGRTRLPDNPVVLRESGMLAELFATDYALIGSSIAYSTSHGGTVRLKEIISRRARNLDDAARWLRQAVGLDSGNELLAVHLGRVLTLRHDDDAAVVVLGAVSTTGKHAEAAYLASLFLGGLRERQGQLDAAIDAYRDALSHLPSAHAAYVGLSQVLQRVGQSDESRAVLLVPLTHKAGPTEDPLWWYHIDKPGVAERRLESLRAEVRQ